MIKREIYAVEDTKLVRQRRFCPRCGPGVFLGEHKDRFSCGRCGYTEFKKEAKPKDVKQKEPAQKEAVHAQEAQKAEAPKESKPKTTDKKAASVSDKPKETTSKGKSKKSAKEE